MVRRSALRPVAPGLLDALHLQDQALPRSAARAANLLSLEQPGTVAVVSGQQVGLFLGPLYTFYKAASAIITARALERESGQRCVPIFWLQTEDHDFAEINHCLVPRPGGAPGPGAGHPQASSSVRLELLREPGDRLARASVAHRVLGDEVTGLHEALGEALGEVRGAPHAAPFLELLARHYRPGQTLARAFAGVLAELFAEEGLLLLDPRQPAVAALSAPVLRQAITHSAEISEALLERSRLLREAGFDEQVHVRPGSTLVFFHEGAIEGPRYRLERRGDALAPQGGSSPPLREAEALALLQRDPLRFSTSALLRPIVQDLLLPTAAYVGGPGEINYLAQVGPLYPIFGATQPLVVPRARFRLLEDNTRALLGKLGLHAADADHPRAWLLERATRAAGGPTQRESAEALGAGMLGALLPYLSQLEATDPSLREPVRKAHETFERTIGKLTERYGKALLERDRVLTERVDRLRGFLSPEGQPQERVFSLPYFACKHGAQALKDRVLQAVRPFEPALQDLDL